MLQFMGRKESGTTEQLNNNNKKDTYHLKCVASCQSGSVTRESQL